MKITRSRLNILIENYLNEVKVTGSDGYEYEKRGNNVYMTKNKGKESNYRLKPGSAEYKAVTKQHPELLSTGDDPTPGDDNFMGPTLAQAQSTLTPQDHLKAIAAAKYPGDELIKNQKPLTQIGPSNKKPYPKGEVVAYVQKMLGMTGDDIDGVYGPDTGELVQKFKDEKGIDPGFNRAAKSGGIANDGPKVIGNSTAEALLKLTSPYKFSSSKQKNAGQSSSKKIQGSAIDDITASSKKIKGSAIDDITAAHDAGRETGMFGDVMHYLGVVGKGIAGFRAWTGLDALDSYALEAAGMPLHFLGLMNLATLRSSKLKITDSAARKAMHNICKYAEKKGKESINYDDYYNGQPTLKKQGTYNKPGFPGSADPMIDNPYGQLSILFGKCFFKKNPDGSYTVSDKYDYNVYRNKGKLKTDFDEVVPTLGNWSNAFGKLYASFVNKTSKASGLEPTLVLYEASLNYPGYPIELKTITPEKGLAMKRDKENANDDYDGFM